MKIISVDQVARLLRLHKSRIEQWISRDQFLPTLSMSQGKKREWDQSEVIRLAVFVRLVDQIGLTPADAGRLTQLGVHGFVDDEAYFVCYKTSAFAEWWRDIVRKRDIGEFLVSGCFIPKVLMSGHSEETLRYNSENLTGPAHLAAIVDLGPIEQLVKEKWPV